MQVKKVASVILVSGCICMTMATFSRVITMGRMDNFFMDDISIFYNPSNISVYPNMLIGDLGIYKFDRSLDVLSSYTTTQGDTLWSEPRYNRDPIRPFFGGILSYSLNQSTEAGDQYPVLSVGAVMNRYDRALDFINPTSKYFKGRPGSVMADPVGKMDILLGAALKGGGMVGAGGYFAFQKMDTTTSMGQTMTMESKVLKGNIGMNWPITKTMDLEFSLGTTYLTGKGLYQIDDTTDAEEEIVADGDVSVGGDIRLFSALTTLNGDFVPHLGLEVINLKEGQEQIINGELGVGLNLNIDRGLFWMGIEAIMSDMDSVQEFGGRVSFGLERNIIWDWLVWRIGGTKTLVYQSKGEGEGKWRQNDEANASDEDVIGFGMGINIENRLKVDAVMAEDLFYTFTNLFSGNHHHIFTRFSATYSF